jgi:hypothetical protein
VNTRQGRAEPAEVDAAASTFTLTAVHERRDDTCTLMPAAALRRFVQGMLNTPIWVAYYVLFTYNT